MYFSYKQVCDVLLKDLKKHQKVLRAGTAPEHERDYSRNCIYHYRELQEIFTSLKEKREL
jgi:hypothetical protein|tara:strand:- start:321 stop:500 length:180 start_codon:yes stop_codon:yes gene_type:complete